MRRGCFCLERPPAPDWRPSPPGGSLLPRSPGKPEFQEGSWQEPLRSRWVHSSSSWLESPPRGLPSAESEGLRLSPLILFLEHRSPLLPHPPLPRCPVQVVLPPLFQNLPLFQGSLSLLQCGSPTYLCPAPTAPFLSSPVASPVRPSSHTAPQSPLCPASGDPATVRF